MNGGRALTLGGPVKGYQLGSNHEGHSSGNTTSQWSDANVLPQEGNNPDPWLRFRSFWVVQ